MNELMEIGGIKCFEKDGVAYLELEAVARGLGFTKMEVKNGTEYITVRWDRVFDYLKEFGFDHKWSKEQFIPENIFYRLAMKAKNAMAERFQAKVADEIIPAIRKTGSYSVKPNAITIDVDTLKLIVSTTISECMKQMIPVTQSEPTMQLTPVKRVRKRNQVVPVRFCEVLNKVTAERNMTNTEVANRMGVSKAAVSLWCSGKCQPNSRNLIRFSMQFNVPMSELVEGIF